MVFTTKMAEFAYAHFTHVTLHHHTATIMFQSWVNTVIPVSLFMSTSNKRFTIIPEELEQLLITEDNCSSQTSSIRNTDSKLKLLAPLLLQCPWVSLSFICIQAYLPESVLDCRHRDHYFVMFFKAQLDLWFCCTLVG